MSTSSETSAPPKMNKLRQDWAKHYGCKPPSRARREFLLLTTEWHRQARVFGGLERTDREVISNLVDMIRQGEEPKTNVGRDQLTPGTVLMREWNGKHYEVRVTAEGFLYGDKTWKSLSQIAREITCARWNGPAFFGLRSRKKVKL